jgi:hypothetical protein
MRINYFLKHINMFKKIRKMFSNKKEEFNNGDDDKGWHYFFIFLTVFAIISFIFDILKYTPVYENNVMKHIINANYWLSYGIGSLFKIICGIMFIHDSIEEDDPDNPCDDPDDPDDPCNEKSPLYLGIIVPIILFTSVIFDIIQFTPLMQNNYINQLVTLNSNMTVMGIMICKLIVPPLLMIISV